MKESIVLDGPPSGPDAPIFRFPIATEGVAVRTNKEGSFEFVDETDKVVFTIPQAFMVDARGGALTPGNAITGVPTEIVKDADGALTIVLRPSVDWLRDKARVYPVVIDPTVQFLPWNPMNLGYSQWGDNSGGASFSTWTNDLIFGNWFGSNWRSFIQFDPSLFAGSTVTKATLNMRVQECGNQTNSAAPYANNIGVHKLTSAYYFGQTWATQPAWNGDVWAAVAGPGTTSSVDITQFAQSWAADARTNFGLMLDMGVAQGYCRVQRTASTGQTTFVEVTFNEAPSYVQEYGFLNNFSFENGMSGWQTCDRAPSAIWSIVTGSTPSGTKHAKLRSKDSSGPVSICQTVRTPTGPEKSYSLIASVRSATGVPISGSISLVEIGGSPAMAVQPFTTSGTAWQNVQIVITGRSSANIGLQADVFVGAPFTTDLDIDYVVVGAWNTPTATPQPNPSPTPTSTSTIPATTSPPPSAPATPFEMYGTSKLTANQYLKSANGKYVAYMGADGNFVVYDITLNPPCPGGPNGGWCWQWDTTTGGNQGAVVYMQDDGNLVVYKYDNPPREPLWQARTNKLGANHVTLGNDGNLSVNLPDGTSRWSWKGGLWNPDNPVTNPSPTPDPTPVVVTPDPPGTGGVVVPVGRQLQDYDPTWIKRRDGSACLSDAYSPLRVSSLQTSSECGAWIPHLQVGGWRLRSSTLEDNCLTRRNSTAVLEPATTR